MIADEIIETVASDKRIKPAVQEMIAHAATLKPVGVTTLTCVHDFVCEVDGRKIDVKISLEVAGQKKH